MHYCEKKKIEEEGRKSSPKVGLQVINSLQNWPRNLHFVIHTYSEETLSLFHCRLLSGFALWLLLGDAWALSLH